MAQTALQRQDARSQAVADLVSELAKMDEPRKQLAGIVSGLDIHYELGEGHRLLGRRMPDLDLLSARGPLRVSELTSPGSARTAIKDLFGALSTWCGAPKSG